MVRAKKRRNPPTLNDRGIGLLEAILPHGTPDDPLLTLPPGQRDQGGFWFPVGYAQPGDIFTPAQRKLQAKQRQVQRRRLQRDVIPPPIVSDSPAIGMIDRTVSLSHPSPAHHSPGPLPAPPAARATFCGAGTDRPLPLPSPSPEAMDPRHPTLEMPVPCCAVPETRMASTLLARPAQAGVLVVDAVVDSRKSSD